MSKTRQTEEIKAMIGEWVIFLQDNEFMGFVGLRQAREIIDSAVDCGHSVVIDSEYFNVEVRGR